MKWHSKVISWWENLSGGSNSGKVLNLLSFNPLPDARRCSVPLTNEGHIRYSMRFVIVALGVLIMAIAVAVKLFKIQIVEHEMHLGQAETILGFRQELIGSRGEICDADNNLLAGNLRTKDLYITPRLLVGEKFKHYEYLPQVAHIVSDFVDMSEDEIIFKCSTVLRHRAEVHIANARLDEAAQARLAALPGVYLRKTEDPRSCVMFYPGDIQDAKVRDSVILALCEELGIEDEASVFQSVNKVLKRQTPVLIAKRVDLDKARKLQVAFNKWNRIMKDGKVKGRKAAPTAIHFDDSTARFYPRKRLLANLLGFCDTDGKGISGIEALMDSEMTPNKGNRYLIPDGNVTSANFLKSVFSPEHDGKKVYLTIQLPIQQIVERYLAKLVEDHKPKRAYAIMMDPKTGAIMAMAQYPNFDGSEKPNEGDNRSFHSLYTTYEPGSIMKAVSVSSAMDHANLNEDTIIFCENGRWHYGGGKALTEHGTVRFGDLTIRQIIQKSSNIGSAKAVIENMTESEFYQYLLAFGLGQKTRLGYYPERGEPKFFADESPGILRPVQKWYKIDISRIAIGHSISITPFQMVQAYSALANGGEMMQPRIVGRVEAADGSVVYCPPVKKSQPISAISAHKIVECMRATVEKGGTATSAAVEGYHVAGKTGTAIKLVRCPDGKMRYSTKYNTASFVGMVPAEDPAFVLLITADEPSGRYQFGGSVCGKTFSNIARETLHLLQIPPAEEPEESTRSAMK